LALNISKGEWDVILRLSQGYERRDIAKDLDVSVSTVNNRIYAAMERTGARTSYQLVAMYIHSTYAALSAPSEGSSDA
jgi:DNA-binding NarL/FixJ family response regulator